MSATGRGGQKAASPARLGWPDVLRCLACVAVVALHISGAPANDLAVTDPAWSVAILVNSLTRWSVPMFILLSGMFLLDPERDFDWGHWRRQTLRLVLITLGAALLFACWDARDAHMGLEYLLEVLIRMVRADLHYHLWFMPMLVGLYLFVPVLRAVTAAGPRVLWYTLGLWAILSITLPFCYRFFVQGAAFQHWLELMPIYNTMGYVGFFLLGYALKALPIKPRQGWLWAAVAALSWLVTFLGVWLPSRAQGSLNSLLFSNFSPFVALTTAGLFMVFRQLDVGKSPIWHRLGKATLWVYLLHPLVLELLL